MERSARKCSSGRLNHQCRSDNKLAIITKKRKRSNAPASATETLADQNWGVRVSILFIFIETFSIFSMYRHFGWV
jgi:hypothetical protein